MNLKTHKHTATVIIGLIFIGGCNHGGNISEKTTSQGIPANVSSVRFGPMSTYTEFSATSVFLFKASIKSSVTGYVDNIYINPGDAVEKKQLLFELRTKEATALMNDSLNNLKFNGIVDVRAATAGLILSIEHPKGDYVGEGDQLCQIAIPGSFAFILDVPYEQSGLIKLNTKCEIILSDSKVIEGVIRSHLPFLTSSSQTERFIVRPVKPENLPENLFGKIRIVKESVIDALSLPKSCILTDETMQSYWVMKLINDTTAVKVIVTTGISEKGFVRIVRPVFKNTDLFLSSGNYGLGDTAYVKILKTPGHEQ